MKHLISIFFFLLPMLGISQKPQEDPQYTKAKDLLYINPDQTIKLSKRLLKSRLQPDAVADINLLISNAYFVKRNLDSSLYYVAQTTNIANSTTKLQTKVKILNFVSMQYQQMELYDKALETIDQAEAINAKLPDGDRDKVLFSGLLSATRGMIYRNQGNPELAAQKLMKAETLFKTLKNFPKNEANISVVLYNLGYCYLDLKQYPTSEKYFRESVFYGQKSKTPSLEAFALKGLGENYLRIQQYQKSIEVLKTADILAKNSQDLTLKTGIFNLLAENYYTLRDWDQFKYYDDQSIQLRTQQEQDQIKSLHRYIQNYNYIYAEKTEKNRRNFWIYEIFIIIATLIFLFLTIRKILHLRA